MACFRSPGSSEHLQSCGWIEGKKKTWPSRFTVDLYVGLNHLDALLSTSDVNRAHGTTKSTSRPSDRRGAGGWKAEAGLTRGGGPGVGLVHPGSTSMWRLLQCLMNTT